MKKILFISFMLVVISASSQVNKTYKNLTVTDTLHWSVLDPAIGAGAPGPTGPSGINGVTGTTGAAGVTGPTGTGSSDWQSNSGVLSPATLTDYIAIGVTGPTGTATALQIYGGAIMAWGGTGTPPDIAGTVMFWSPSKKAFRAGFNYAALWNNASIGAYSAAFGENSAATAQGSFATGTGGAYTSAAGGAYGTSLGDGSNYGSYGLTCAWDGANYAQAAQTFGFYTANYVFASMVIGCSNIKHTGGTITTSYVAREPMFVIGNGNVYAAKFSNAVTVLKNGSFGINARDTLDYPRSLFQVNTKNSYYPPTGYVFNFVDNRRNNYLGSYAQSTDTASFNGVFTATGKLEINLKNNIAATSFKIDSNAIVKIGVSPNYVEISPDSGVRYYGTAIVWKDMQGDVSSLKTIGIANKPDFNTKYFTFDFPEDTTEMLGAKFQFQHDLAYGYDSVHIHVHWLQEHDTLPDIKVDYLWTEICDTLNTTTAAANIVWTRLEPVDDACTYTTGIQESIIYYSGIPNTVTTPSSILRVRIYRKSDDYPETDVKIDYIDVHYPVDRSGTNNEY